MDTWTDHHLIAFLLNILSCITKIITANTRVVKNKGQCENEFSWFKEIIILFKKYYKPKLIIII